MRTDKRLRSPEVALAKAARARAKGQLTRAKLLEEVAALNGLAWEAGEAKAMEDRLRLWHRLVRERQELEAKAFRRRRHDHYLRCAIPEPNCHTCDLMGLYRMRRRKPRAKRSQPPKLAPPTFVPSIDLDTPWPKR